MHPKKTYELTIAFIDNADANNLKSQVKDWLTGIGEDTFVEGVVDGLDLDFDYENQDQDYYGDLGGNLAPF